MYKPAARLDGRNTEYIELYNSNPWPEDHHGNDPVGLSWCILSDDPQTNKFVIQTNTVIAPRGFVYFTETDLGFSLNAAGETIYFKTPDGSRVLDALRFGAQENGVSYGGFPDGGEWSRLGEHGKWGAEFYRCLCRGRERTNCSKAWQGAPAW